MCSNMRAGMCGPSRFRHRGTGPVNGRARFVTNSGSKGIFFSSSRSLVHCSVRARGFSYLQGSGMCAITSVGKAV